MGDSNLEKIDDKQYLNRSHPKETRVLIIQMICNGWFVVNGQQFSNPFSLHEHLLSEELPGDY